VAEILEPGRRARRDGTYVPAPKPTREEIRAEIALGGVRAILGQGRARVHYWDEYMAGAFW
jgi:hypothetical protein